MNGAFYSRLRRPLEGGLTLVLVKIKLFETVISRIDLTLATFSDELEWCLNEGKVQTLLRE